MSKSVRSTVPAPDAGSMERQRGLWNEVAATEGALREFPRLGKWVWCIPSHEFQLFRASESSAPRQPVAGLPFSQDALSGVVQIIATTISVPIQPLPRTTRGRASAPHLSSTCRTQLCRQHVRSDGSSVLRTLHGRTSRCQSTILSKRHDGGNPFAIPLESCAVTSLNFRQLRQRDQSIHDGFKVLWFGRRTGRRPICSGGLCRRVPISSCGPAFPVPHVFLLNICLTIERGLFGHFTLIVNSFSFRDMFRKCQFPDSRPV